MTSSRSRASGVFVTGTDTGVGKTVVAAALAAALHARGVDVGVMKPVESGCSLVDGHLVPGDAVSLREAAGTRDALDLVNPYRLHSPLAPALAAELEGVRIDMAAILGSYRELGARHEMVLVEGAGGFLAPLAGDLTMRDLARELDIPVLVIAKNALGTINHTAMTVQAALASGLAVAGIILNDVAPPADEAARSNPDSLRRWGGAPVLGHLAHQVDRRPSALARAAEANLDVEAIMSAVGYVPRALANKGK